MDHAHEIRVERLVPRAEHQRADRPEIDQRERVRIRSLANALFNATVREPDRARRLAVAERIAALHTQHGQEPAVREPLALALYNVTVGEPGSSVHTDFVRRAARFATEPSIMRRYPSRAVR